MYSNHRSTVSSSRESVTESSRRALSLDHRQSTERAHTPSPWQSCPAGAFRLIIDADNLSEAVPLEAFPLVSAFQPPEWQLSFWKPDYVIEWHRSIAIQS